MRPRVLTGYAAIAAVIGCAGCTGTAPARPAAIRSLSSPGCSTATAQAPLLTGARTAMTPVQGNPFGVAVTSDGRWAFVSLITSIEVLRLGAPLAPVPVRNIPVPTNAGAGAVGEALTPDGRDLLAASGSGAVVISVARAEQGSPGAVLGTLRDPRGGSGAIEVAVSRDGRFAFVTQEDSATAAVFDLSKGFGASAFVGGIPLGLAPVGMAISPDGRWLYATSEIAKSGAPGRGPGGRTGTLTVIDVRRAETDPAASVAATVDAGCSPVRVVASADGGTVWVTARESDDLLAFSAARLRSQRAKALIAVVRVGEAPVGLALVRDGARIVVADSNRFGSRASADLRIVNVTAALAGKPAVIGHVPAGGFPREMALEPGGETLLVTNFSSNQLEAVGVTTIP